MSDTTTETVDTLYFGCYKDTGHFLRLPNGRWMSGQDLNRELPFTTGEIDQGFCPKDIPQDEGRAATHQSRGWSILSFWDRSVDHRPGSHSTYFFRGDFNFHELCAMAKAQFPEIWERYRFEVTPHRFYLHHESNEDKER